MASLLKKDWSKIRIINRYWYVIDVEKGIRGGIVHAIHWYTKADNKYMKKNYYKNITSWYLMYLDASNLYGRGMSQKLPVNSFKWIKMYLNLMKTSSNKGQ